MIIVILPDKTAHMCKTSGDHVTYFSLWLKQRAARSHKFLPGKTVYFNLFQITVNEVLCELCTYVVQMRNFIVR